MLCITMQLDISIRLTPQVTTIICYHMKKVLLMVCQLPTRGILTSLLSSHEW